MEVTDARLPGTIHSVTEEIAAEGGTALPVVMNLRDGESITGAVDQVIAEWGRIDILVNNAAIFIPGGITDARDRHIELSIAINLVGPIIAMRAVVPHMRDAGGGHIINVSSRGSIMPASDPTPRTRSRASATCCTGRRSPASSTSRSARRWRCRATTSPSTCSRPTAASRRRATSSSENDPENPTLDFETADDMGKATVWMCEQDASSYTGNIVYDEDVVREHNL